MTGESDANGGAERFFDAISARYDRTYALPTELSRERMRRVIAELPAPPCRVLDLGVGTGRELPALLDAGYEPTGVDVSRSMLERCARRSRPIPLVRADFWSPLPFDDGAFQTALALHGTLAHAPDEEHALSRLGGELSRVIVPQGVLIAEVPSPEWLDRIVETPLSSDRTLRRTGARTCVFEDRVAGATIAARVLTRDEWKMALGDAWDTHVEPLGELEWLVVARSRASR